MSNPAPDSNPSPAGGPSIFAIIIGLIGALTLVFAALGVVNTYFDLQLQLEVYGAPVEVPDSYEVCAGLAAVGVLLLAATVFGSWFAATWRRLKGRTAARVGLAAATIVLLVIAGRGLQVLALTQTYGSMLAYYAADGQLDEVEAELAKQPSVQDLDDAVSRAVFHDQPEVLARLLEHGADFRQSSRPAERQLCLLGGGKPRMIEVALEHGVGPDACPNSEALIAETVKFGHDDQAIAKLIPKLVTAGWSPKTVDESSKQSALQLARSKQMTTTVQALEAAAATP